MSADQELDALERAAAIVDRSDRGAVLVSGPDTWSFLQAIVSADVDAIADGRGARSLLLTPQGKLGVVFRLLRVGDDAWLDCDPGMGAELTGGIDRFRIRVKAEVEDRGDSWGTISLVGPEVDSRFDRRAPSGMHDHTACDGVRVVRTAVGLDIVGARDDVERTSRRLQDAGWTVAGPGAWAAYRVRHGIPEQPDDLPGGTIPQEAHLEADAVSFTKGCFLGQELVCRIDNRGHVNRFLRRLVDVQADAWPPPGAEVVVGDSVVGAITSVAPAELPVGALAYVRREVELGAEVALRWLGGTARARVEQLLG